MIALAIVWYLIGSIGAIFILRKDSPITLLDLIVCLIAGGITGAAGVFSLLYLWHYDDFQCKLPIWLKRDLF